MERKEVFLWGMENLRAVGKPEQLSLKTSVRIFAFYILLCAVARRREPGKKLFFISGIPEVKRKDPTGGEYERVFVRRFSGNRTELREWTSLPSLLSGAERFDVFRKALFTAPRGGHYLGRWFEFLLLCRAFDEGRIGSVCSFGHYDEFTYWLTGLCAERNIPYTMYQHGIVMESVDVPNPVRCDRVHVYNRYSEKVFREKIVANPDCVMEIDGLPCSVTFETLEKEEGRRYVGIIDQADDTWTRRIADSLRRIPGCVPVVMKHPLRAGERMWENGQDVMETTKKYGNLDALIVNFSTLALDYISWGYNGPMICTNPEAVRTIFSEYPLRYAPDEAVAEEVEKLLGMRESNDGIAAEAKP